MGPIRSSARCTWAQRSARQPSLCGAVIEPPVFCGSSAGPASPDRKAILGRGGAGAVLEVAHDPPPTGMEIQTMYISRPSYLGHRPKALAVQAVLTLRRHPPDQQGRWGEVATKARNELAVAFQSQGSASPKCSGCSNTGVAKSSRHPPRKFPRTGVAKPSLSCTRALFERWINSTGLSMQARLSAS